MTGRRYRVNVAGVSHRDHIAETVDEEVVSLRVLTEVDSFLILIVFDLFIDEVLLLNGLLIYHFKLVWYTSMSTFDHVVALG